MNMGTASDLMHNRIQVQLMAHYYGMGCDVTLKSTNSMNQNIKHDFNLASLSCEVKTIQSIGEIEHRELGGFRFSEKSVLSLAAAIRDDLEKAKEQTTNGGMIFIAPWSYRIN